MKPAAPNLRNMQQPKNQDQNPHSAEVTVRVENLTKVYGSQRVVDDISFDVKKGRVLGFLGPNGAGKSTTMKILAGCLSSTQGRAWIGGLPISRSAKEVKRVVGYLPENNPLYSDLYVKESLGYLAGIYQLGHAKKRIAEVIEITGLANEQHKKIRELSKGYRQRLGLAQAIIHDPEILILDEPTSGLDPIQLVEIRKLIIQLGREKTLIFSTHIMQEVEQLCQDIIIINKGKIVADFNADFPPSRFQGKKLEDVFMNVSHS